MAQAGADWESKRQQVVQILETIINDADTPRNIRRIAKQASTELFNEKLRPAVRAANSIELIEEIINDPNMPSFTRTQLWMAISILETIRSSQT
ncbi:MAG: UPF0147 family protein [Candidatus Caldarchaeum sp.]|jgi:hypothetical protein|uniref:UPF0147 protein CSUB_C0129 n=1 Tax=Caldiarchaeum subterraneum TaxID=311458 RepID=E6N3N7_CALS0|nr:UPF0147 family protein [Candidatus Caldarchaeales archaeon]BAJ46943.1 hypothetical conserved protein [Candidatus Caldarchaeum subterraneum]MDJ0273493.1 UPF0147 family protein [Candidatus Caldarchaeales archaeon]BAJ49044.1 conserved hypothetical protein [Candidatus Caldarchaeum subterraneum]BAJ49074.1 conserved hypothetical protein [Candidatus Caldarchaeum subterraneum]